MQLVVVVVVEHVCNLWASDYALVACLATLLLLAEYFEYYASIHVYTT